MALSWRMHACTSVHAHSVDGAARRPARAAAAAAAYGRGRARHVGAHLPAGAGAAAPGAAHRWAHACVLRSPKCMRACTQGADPAAKPRAASRPPQRQPQPQAACPVHGVETSGAGAALLACTHACMQAWTTAGQHSVLMLWGPYQERRAGWLHGRLCRLSSADGTLGRRRPYE